MLERWRWQTLTELDGKSPQCMTADKSGAMWFGTRDGVMKYDGLRWESFSVWDGVGGVVNDLNCSVDGVLLAASSSGISRYANGVWRRVFPLETNSVLRVNRVIQGADGTIWAGGDGFLLRGSGTTWIVYGASNVLAASRGVFSGAKTVLMPTANVEALYAARDNTIWVAFNTGTVRSVDLKAPAETPEVFRTHTAGNGFHAGLGMQFLYQSTDGVIWSGNGHHNVGVNRFDAVTGKWSHFRFTDILASDEITVCMAEGPDGDVWIGGLSKIYRLKDGEWRVYRIPEVPITTAEVSAMVFAHDALWLLGKGDGVQKIEITARHWVKYQGINFQCETPDGRRWFVSADDGVVSHDGTSWLRYGTEDGLMTSPCMLLCTKEGRLWAAGSHEQVAATACFDGNKWVTIKHPKANTKTFDYRAGIVAQDGSVWFGTYVDGGARIGDGGLAKFNSRIDSDPANEGAWTYYHGGRNSTSYGFANVAGGKFYSGSYLGLVEYTGTNWLEVTPTKGQRVDALCSSVDGKTLWIGTRGCGVLRFDGNSVRHFTAQDGLAANSVSSVSCDQENRLWVMTSQGVSLFDGEQWITDVFPRQQMGSEGGRIKQSRDGSLWFNQCYRNWMRRILSDRKADERLLKDFWTVHYTRERGVPETEIVASVERVSQPGNTAISWRGSDPWCRTEPGELVYSYRLNSGPWSAYERKNNHVFLELAPGDYVFEVRARDKDLNVDPTPARVRFMVLPPVWKQPWFIAMMTALVAASATQSMRVLLRGRRLKKTNNALALKIEEHQRTESQLAAKTLLLEAEVAERRLAQTALEEQHAALEREIEERKRMEREVEKVHKQLLATSRKAGMAEVAASVLHNVGNVLNSLNVSARVLWDHTEQSRIPHVRKLESLLNQHKDDLVRFLTQDERGRKFPKYLKLLADSLENERATLRSELASARQFIDQIIHIIARQQEHAQGSVLSETLSLPEVVDDAVRLLQPNFSESGVQLVRDYSDVPPQRADRHKLIRIVTNLLTNAIRSCCRSERDLRQVLIRIGSANEHFVFIEVEDNGAGIAPEELRSVFAAATANGGLHDNALAAKEMGGSLSADSGGVGKGARFVLELPVNARKSSETLVS